MELLLRPVEARVPSLHVVGRCGAAPPPLEHWKRAFTTGKRIEMVPELLFSRALASVPRDAEAPMVFFDNCPYWSKLSDKNPDPYQDAYRVTTDMGSEIGSIVATGKACVYFALHPLSYPPHTSATRYCTALVEDKTLHGNDHDIVVPAGALDYGVASTRRQCTLSYFGRPHGMSAEFQNIRGRVREAMARLREPDACIIEATGEAYVRRIGDSKFCFVLPGDTRGGEKLALAIMQGCVPVIDHYSWKHLPFFPYLNYSRFAVRMPGTWNVRTLLTQLRGANVTDYQHHLRRARDWFDYQRQGEEVSPYTLIWTQVMEAWA